MKSYQPKKMPAAIEGKYSDVVYMRTLFSFMLSKDDRASVCDSVVESLSRRYGVVYCDVYWDKNGQDIPLTRLRQEAGMSMTEFVDLLYSTDEYGGSESVSRELALAIQPYWNKWWDRFDLNILELDTPIIDSVLGREQILWISAQIARRATRFAGPAATTLVWALDVIEDWIAGRSSKSDVRRLVDDILDSTDSVALADEAPFASADAVMRFCEMAGDTSIMAIHTFRGVVRNASFAEGFAKDPGANDADRARNTAAARLACADVARAVFTPTLITTASRGLR